MKTLFPFMLLLLAGCASTGKWVDLSKADQIKTGQTTQADILKMFGTPTQTTRLSGGASTFQYTYAKAESSPFVLVPVVGLLDTPKVEAQCLLIQFDTGGIVTNYVATHSGDDMSISTNVTSSPKASGWH